MAALACLVPPQCLSSTSLPLCPLWTSIASVVGVVTVVVVIVGGGVVTNLLTTAFSHSTTPLLSSPTLPQLQHLGENGEINAWNKAKAAVMIADMMMNFDRLLIVDHHATQKIICGQLKTQCF